MEFVACGAAHDPSMSGGLTWTELSAVTAAALDTEGCYGWSVSVYNPDLDPDGREARRIVAYIANVIGGSSERSERPFAKRLPARAPARLSARSPNSHSQSTSMNLVR